MEFPFYLKWNLRILNGEKEDGKPTDSLGSISNSVLRYQRLMVLEDFINMGTSLIRLNSVGSYYFPPCTKANYFTDVQELEIEFCLSSLALTDNNCQPQSQEVYASLFHQRNFAMLNEHDHLFDVTLKLKDGVTLGAHKIILSASSPVFRAMFTSGMKESTENEVQIPDISSEAMKIVLKFIYTHEISDSWKHNAVEVVHGASKYGLVDLLEYLNTNLITACTVENAVELFKLAKLHNWDKAMEQLTEFTKKHTADVILGMRVE